LDENGPVTEEPDVEAVGTLLADPTVRTILVQTSQEPMPVSTLEDHCDASEATIYRRLSDLRDYGFVAEHTEPDVEGGHHRQVYAARPRRITVELQDGRLECDVDRREPMADRFTRLVEGL
jgi:predicted transcriptional regulator